ncbi:hypothetical protein CEXT_46431 [Caerostris extrusa]|uniref:Uncharacterized protein n=1 Tax=Caerostris extrusa TaxID=172846 RepID=A0AAV4VLC8_CAEEX|nr:hypothetical protein CEXT_46431 [Caerostris extrusa]
MSSVAKGFPITHVSQKRKLKLKNNWGETGNEGKVRIVSVEGKHLIICAAVPLFLLPFQSRQSCSGAVVKIIKSTEMCR